MPEVTNAVSRMALGAQPISARTSEWLSEAHTTTGAPIHGHLLPLCPQVLDLARRAHTAFDDHIVIGWDIAVLAEGAVAIEGNAAPCVDLIQRPERRPLRATRFGELAAFHAGRIGSRGPSVRNRGA